MSQAERRRVGQSSCVYADADSEGVIHSTPIETDWSLIESVFAAKGVTVARDHVGNG